MNLGFARKFGLGVAVATMMSATAAYAETVLKAGNGAEPESLDPHISETVPSYTILLDLYEGLTTFAEDGEPIPAAAESWTVSDDGKVWTFKIRQNATWSNGDPLTAEDFVYSFRRAVDPATASPYAYALGPIVGADEINGGDEKDLTKLGVAALDEKTLTITLENATPYLPELLKLSVAMPVHKGSIEKFGDKWTQAGNLVSNGAYTLKEWTPKSQIVLQKNPNYYDAANVKIDQVIYYPIEEESEELKRWRAGELHVTSTIPIDQIDFVKKNYPGEARIATYFGTYYYLLNQKNGPTAGNLKLRQALTLAIDRDTLTKKVTGAGEIPAYEWVPEGVPGYENGSIGVIGKGMNQKQREAEAKKLFAEAGYGPNKPLKLEILFNNSEAHKKIALSIAQMWRKALGDVTVTVRNSEFRVAIEERKQLRYDVARAAWIGDFRDPATFLDYFKCNSGNNDAGYCNEEYDALLKKAEAITEPKARFDTLKQAEAILLQDLPLLPIYHYVNKNMVSKKVKGWTDNLLGYHLTRYKSIEG